MDRDLLELGIVGIVTSYSWDSATFTVIGTSEHNVKT